MERRTFLQGIVAAGGWSGLAKNYGKAAAPEAATSNGAQAATLLPVAPKCEYAGNPLGLDVASPRLSWRLEAPGRAHLQTAYQILVAGSTEKLAAGAGDLWDSGKVASGRSIHIAYQGRTLDSFERCYWKVRAWDQAGQVSPYSEGATWEMGPLHDADWQAQWISAGYLLDAAATPANTHSLPRQHRAPLLRKEFHLRDQPRRARAYICGLGYYELYVNGAKAGDHVLDPAQTDYDARAFYVTYDVTGNLKAGANALGVMLGSGWFNQDEVWQKGKYSIPEGTNYGVPRLFLQLRVEYQDGSVETSITNDGWKASPGPTLENNVYAGETYDARLEMPGWAEPGFADATWQNARVVAAPTRHLEAQTLPPIKAVKTLPSVALAEPKPGVFVYDFGQNFTGWARLRVTAPRGTSIILRFAESVAPDGMIDPASTGVFATEVVQTDTYITKGEGEEVWEPRFTYHGFRYAELTGFPGKPSPSNLEGVVVHTAVEKAGTFECSDPMLNRIHDTALWTEISNLHGVPTDCPAREKCGWLGDAQVSGEMTIYNLDMAQFWAKYLEDIRTSAEDGLPTMVAPGKRSLGVAVPDWGTAVVQIPWYVYLYYGDTRILEQNYDAMCRWLAHLEQLSRNSIVAEGLGDWCPPGSVEPNETPIPLTSTAYFYLDARILGEVAAVLGKKEDAARCRALAVKIREAFNREFLRLDGTGYGSQTADALALRLGLVPAGSEVQVAASLAKDVLQRHGGHFSTGITGSRCLYGELTNYGFGQVAVDIFHNTTYPSIGYLFSLGATTLWETWGEPELDRQHGPRSRNHAMQADFDAWFYQGLAGIAPDPRQPGFKHILLRPQVVSSLERVHAEYESVYGKIVSSWRLAGESFTWHIRVPANTHATVAVPCDDPVAVTESGRPVRQAPGITWQSENPGRAILEAGSGEYDFVSSLAKNLRAPVAPRFPRPWW